MGGYGESGGTLRTGGSISVGGLLRAGGLRCRAQNDALRDFAGGHQLPQRDEQLARQSLPLRRQGAMIMVLRVAPRASAVRTPDPFAHPLAFLNLGKPPP